MRISRKKGLKEPLLGTGINRLNTLKEAAEDDEDMQINVKREDVRAEVNRNLEEIQKQQELNEKFWNRSIDTDTRQLLDEIIEQEKESNW